MHTSQGRRRGLTNMASCRDAHGERGYEARSPSLAAYGALQQEVLVAHRFRSCCSLSSLLT
jgi:hypothetical protein